MEEEFEGIDLSSFKKGKELLTKLSVDRYWNHFKGDWKSYMDDVFKYDDIPQKYVKPEPIVVKEVHPFENWI